MKKLLFMLATVAILAVSCDRSSDDLKTVQVSVSLEMDGWAVPTTTKADGSSDFHWVSKADRPVKLKDLNSSAIYDGITDATGTAVFNVLPGIYEASSTFSVTSEVEVTLFNGLASNLNVTAGSDKYFKLALKRSKSNAIIIKEFYLGGCPKDDGSGAFTQDRYVILYNNSAEKVDASNICFAFIGSNSNAANILKGLIDEEGNLVYEKEGMIPAMHGVWRFNTTVEIEPYSQIVVAVTGAIDHTKTYNLSVNLANSAYYAMYDPESGYNIANMYPAPDTSVPTTNYLKATKYGSGTGWTISVSSPAFFIFNKAGIHEYASNIDNRDTRGMFEGAKIPFEWIVDGVEVFLRGADDKNTKRLTANVDAGNVQHTNKLGYSIYRNVDKAATEAIEGNKDKLVYGYAGGTKDIDVEGGTTDPSGIDAEKSIANGAKIVYVDTNNSTNDFHERVFASLTGK